MNKTFRHNAGFGKRMEYFVISRMLEQGLDVYIPLIDDNAIDAVIRKQNGTFVEVQIKARSKDVTFGDAALFAAITHEHRDNYYFIFYSHRLDKMWILSSEEFITEAKQNKNGKNVGKRSIWFNGKNTRNQSEHPKPRFDKYLKENFEMFR
ncbi:group I intron-associated PD-(D/E)XK endonuclease [Chryseobacterium sp. MHB01]|uniref:group I intron-associated PD-(D/E)XK endonuclease n=1 Tax=Chryseobacterium sp. MHB01 TaxID=3109433 RepID=UPI002B000EB0|nr:group I intron-associated PD-(D/E)XK endonuclease [Chryseobacterium sp. MHB01]MEA1847511.1 group I intron-associated PD-(D/E)XK endonuclease [Chryseobacterium sp. MHB01]